jgi:hypothetical protein
VDTNITSGIETLVAPGSYDMSSQEAWINLACPYCNAAMLVVVGRRGTRDQLAAGYPQNFWLYCMNCGRGSVRNGNEMVPGRMEFPIPEGTPEQEAQLWEEIRRCLSVSAFNAVAMLCRKLLLHMVFTHKRSINSNATPDDLSFAAAVRYLANNGVITEAMNNLATNIKDVGNKANHELPHITETDGRDIALFTHYLFISIYEMPKRARYETAFVGAAAQPYEGNLGADAQDDEPSTGANHVVA